MPSDLSSYLESDEMWTSVIDEFVRVTDPEILGEVSLIDDPENIR
jgi:hypothetical protein